MPYNTKGYVSCLAWTTLYSTRGGVENKVADALSRREHEPAGEVNGFSLVIPTWVQDVIQS